MDISKRVSEFKSRFQNLLGPKRQGYDDLDALERPLVGGADDEDYEGPQRAAYRPPGAAGGAAEEGVETGRPASFTVALPSQTEEIQEVSALSKDASEILWEMVAMGETGASMQEMRSRAEQLQAQLRGLINDYAGGDEKIFAGAFEAFEMLSRCLDDQKAPENAAPPVAAEAAEVPAAVEEPAAAQEQPRPVVAPPPAMPAAVVAAPGGADLISFD